MFLSAFPAFCCCEIPGAIDYWQENTKIPSKLLALRTSSTNVRGKMMSVFCKCVELQRKFEQKECSYSSCTMLWFLKIRILPSWEQRHPILSPAGMTYLAQCMWQVIFLMWSFESNGWEWDCGGGGRASCNSLILGQIINHTEIWTPYREFLTTVQMNNWVQRLIHSFTFLKHDLTARFPVAMTTDSGMTKWPRQLPWLIIVTPFLLTVQFSWSSGTLP